MSRVRPGAPTKPQKDAATYDRLPSTKAECQRILRGLGYTRCRIFAIEANRLFITEPDGDGKRAKTISFLFANNEVHVASEDGWPV